jgi:hypothetical protein
VSAALQICSPTYCRAHGGSGGRATQGRRFGHVSIPEGWMTIAQRFQRWDHSWITPSPDGTAEEESRFHCIFRRRGHVITGNMRLKWSEIFSLQAGATAVFWHSGFITALVWVWEVKKRDGHPTSSARFFLRTTPVPTYGLTPLGPRGYIHHRR